MTNPNNNTLTLIEAAKLIGVSTQTIRRLIQRKSIAAQQALGPHGLRWEIERVELLRYLDLYHGGQQQPLSVDLNNATRPPRVDHCQGVENGQHTYQQAQSVPLAAHLAALELAKIQLDRLQHQAEEAQRAVLHAERAKISLEAQLGQYQRVLAEQAESLAEERARRMAVEAKSVEESLPQPALTVEPKTAGYVGENSRVGFGQRLKRWLLGA